MEGVRFIGDDDAVLLCTSNRLALNMVAFGRDTKHHDKFP